MKRKMNQLNHCNQSLGQNSPSLYNTVSPTIHSMLKKLIIEALLFFSSSIRTSRLVLLDDAKANT